MTIVVIQRSERLVTKGELSNAEITVIKTMLTVGNPLKEVKEHLKKQGHTIMGNNRKEELNVLFFSTENFSKKELEEMIKAVSELDSI